ncbi:hypothetical protein ABIB40_002327 [Pedobacter sp. UYP30]
MGYCLHINEHLISNSAVTSPFKLAKKQAKGLAKIIFL